MSAFFPPEWIGALLELRKARLIGWRTLGVGVALGSFANVQRRCWPSVAALSERSGVAGRHISAELSRLEAVGALERTVNRGKVSRFKLIIPMTVSVGGGVTVSVRGPLTESVTRKEVIEGRQ